MSPQNYYFFLNCATIMNIFKIFYVKNVWFSKHYKTQKKRPKPLFNWIKGE